MHYYYSHYAACIRIIYFGSVKAKQTKPALTKQDDFFLLDCKQLSKSHLQRAQAPQNIECFNFLSLTTSQCSRPLQCPFVMLVSTWNLIFLTHRAAYANTNTERSIMGLESLVNTTLNQCREICFSYTFIHNQNKRYYFNFPRWHRVIRNLSLCIGANWAVGFLSASNGSIMEYQLWKKYWDWDIIWCNIPILRGSWPDRDSQWSSNRMSSSSQTEGFLLFSLHWDFPFPSRLLSCPFPSQACVWLSCSADIWLWNSSWGPAWWKLQNVLFSAKLLKRPFQFRVLGGEKGTNTLSRASSFPAPPPCAWLGPSSRDTVGYSVNVFMEVSW